MAYGRPGVYVTERLLPAPITVAGAANAAGAAIGQFGQGPEAVTLVTSWYDFVQKFGGYNTLYPATFGVGQFFKNGGTELYVRRVLGDGAAAASVAIPGTTGTIGTMTAKNKGTDGNKLRFQFSAAGTAGYFNLVIYKEVGTDSGSTADDIVLEQFLNVTVTDTASSDFLTTVLSQESSYVSAVITNNNTTAPGVALTPLAGGNNGVAATDAQFTAALGDFTSIDRSLVVFAPEVIKDLGATAGAIVQDSIIDWVESNDGFAILDTAADLTVTNAVSFASGRGASSNAAIYYPNLYIADPLGRNASSLRKVGPAGAMAGLYLSTDRQFGPFKAPAGIRQAIGGAVSTERQFTASELDTLNSAAFPLNAIRNVPGAGVVPMGARTLKQDGTPNRYVNSRRSLLYIKRQLETLTEFALFENNSEQLWARIRTSLGVFLNEYRNQGGLRGTTEAEAFFVKCDAENNTAANIAAGEVHIEVGVALEYPAEFVVITLSQKTSN